MQTQKASSAVHPQAVGAYPPWKIESTTIVALTAAPRPNRETAPAIEPTLVPRTTLTTVATVQSSDPMGETCPRRLALGAHNLLTANAKSPVSGASTRRSG